MELLQLQLNKVNQLLNDTIAEKCKQELIYQQHTQSQHQPIVNRHSQNINNNRSESLFRASLVPVGQSQTDLKHQSNSSVWKSSQKLDQFSSVENLPSEINNKYNGNTNNTSNYVQVPIKVNKQSPHSSNGSSHYYYVTANNSSKLDPNISKSIDSIHNLNTNHSATNGLNVSSAFNPARKTALLDLNEDNYREMPISFQPVNFTNSRPSQNNLTQVTSQNRNSKENFKRDIIAEKKRASIGKYPNNFNVNIISHFIFKMIYSFRAFLKL